MSLTDEAQREMQIDREPKPENRSSPEELFTVIEEFSKFFRSICYSADTRTRIKTLPITPEMAEIAWRVIQKMVKLAPKGYYGLAEHARMQLSIDNGKVTHVDITQ